METVTDISGVLSVLEVCGGSCVWRPSDNERPLGGLPTAGGFHNLPIAIKSSSFAARNTRLLMLKRFHTLIIKPVIYCNALCVSNTSFEWPFT